MISGRGLDAFAGKIDLRGLLEGIEYRVARTGDELEKAYSLVHREYLKRNYVSDGGPKLRVSIHNALPQTTTFVTVADSDVLATATVIPDSPLGLPMDSLYHEDMDGFRKEGKKVCEISMLASDTEILKNGTSALLDARKMFFIFFLFKCIFDYVREVLRLDYICIAINPRHRMLYDFLLFKSLGRLKTYKNVNQAPAIGRYIDVNLAEEECLKSGKSGLHRMFFRRKTLPEQFSEKVSLDCETLKYFFVKKTDTLKNARPPEMEYLKSRYPACDFSRMMS